jgi:VWFA-related protein
VNKAVVNSMSLAFLLIGSLLAQEGGKEARFRIRSDVVLVDFVATDKNGDFVSDLELSELEVYEDGKKQEVSFFDLVNRSSERGASLFKSDVGPHLLTDNRREFLRGEPGAVMVFLLDLNNISPSYFGPVQKSIQAFLDDHPNPYDKVMIATVRYGLNIPQPLTAEPAKVEQTLGSLQATGGLRRSFRQFVAEMERTITSEQRLDLSWGRGRSFGSSAGNEGRLRIAVGLARRFLRELELSMEQTCDALSALATHLRVIPGRKQIVFYSMGYPLQAGLLVEDILARITEDSGVSPGEISSWIRGLAGLGDSVKRLQRVIDGLNRSHVSVYSVDPRGLLNTVSAEDRALIGPRSLNTSAMDISAPQEFLKNLSDGSGGRASLNSNDLGQGIQWAYDDASRYYLVGYVPNSPRKTGRFHEIKVRVVERKLKIRSRRGYFETSGEVAFQNDISTALAFPGLFQDFPFAVETTLEGKRLRVQVLIPMESLVFTPANSQYSSYLDVFGAVADDSGKFLEENVSFVKHLKIGVKEWAPEALRLGKDIQSEMEVGAMATGNYHLIVGVRQMPSGSLATEIVQISID